MRKLLNIIYNPKFKLAFLLIILFTLYLFICANSYVSAVSKDIANSVFRLHVIANSDLKEDQDLKYIVRDEVIKYMESLTTTSASKEESMQIAIAHKNDFEQLSKKTIQDHGYNYDVNVNIGNFYFPTKTYGDISLPSGNYDALRIEIGEAKGQNWWCVMFPPLCFVDVTSGIVPEDSKELIRESLSEEEYDLIAKGNNEEEAKGDIKFKFKLIEFLQGSNFFTAKN